MSDIGEFEEPYEDEVPSVGTVRVGKATYAVALIWQEADADADVASAARAVAADPGVSGDSFCTRPGSRQFGVGMKASGHAKGMPSLAAQLAEARKGAGSSWIGLFEVEGGFYLLAVREELILANTDRVYPDEMAARGEFETLLNMDSWGEIYAPASMDIEAASDSTVQQVAGTTKAPRLRDIDRVSSHMRWALAAAVLLLLVGGGLYYQSYLNELALQAAEDERIAQLRANMPLVGEQVVPVPPMPWEGRPTASAYLDACMAGMRKAVLDYPGWTPAKMECDASAGVRLDIARTNSLEQGGGTVNWIRWTLDRSPEMSKAAILPQGPDGATVSWAAERLENYPPDLNPRAPDIGKSRFYLQSWFEEAFTTIAFPKAQQSDFVRTVSFSFTTGYEPTRFSEILSKVPGLTVDKVTVDLRKLPLAFVVEGAVHEQLPLPKNARRGAPPGAPAPGGPAAAPAPPPRT